MSDSVTRSDGGGNAGEQNRAHTRSRLPLLPPSSTEPRIVWRGGTSLRLNDNLLVFTAAVHLAVTHIVIKIIRAYTMLSSRVFNPKLLAKIGVSYHIYLDHDILLSSGVFWVIFRRCPNLTNFLLQRILILFTDEKKH